jgi:hypothetical protein
LSCAEPVVSTPQWEREHRLQTDLERSLHEAREPLFVPQIGHRDGFAGPVRDHARPLAQFGLQLLETQRRSIRGGDVTGIDARRNECHSDRGDRKDVNDALDQVIEDRLDREVGEHRAGELAQHV